MKAFMVEKIYDLSGRDLQKITYAFKPVGNIVTVRTSGTKIIEVYFMRTEQYSVISASADGCSHYVDVPELLNKKLDMIKGKPRCTRADLRISDGALYVSWNRGNKYYSQRILQNKTSDRLYIAEEGDYNVPKHVVQFLKKARGKTPVEVCQLIKEEYLNENS